MSIQSVLDFPSEIKKIVELFYAGNSKSAYDEAYRIQEKRADLGMFIDCVLTLFQDAPSTPAAFNDKLLLQYQAACDPELEFEFYQDFINLSSSPSGDNIGTDEARFHAELAETLAAETKVPAILSDASSSRSRRRSSAINFYSNQTPLPSSDVFGKDIPIEIDIDFELTSDVGGLSGDNDAQQRNNYNVDEAYRRLQAAKSYPTPPARAPVSTSQSVPSIMRAAQASEGRSTPNESKFGRRRTQTGAGLSPDLKLTPFDDTKKRQVIGNDLNRGSYSPNGMPTVDQISAVNSVTQINLQQINASNKRQKMDTLRDIDVDVVIEKAGIAALKPLNRVPVLKLTRDDLAKRRDIDAKAGYILSLIDGETSLLDIMDISSWTAAETTDILAHLLAQAVIGFRA